MKRFFSLLLIALLLCLPVFSAHADGGFIRLEDGVLSDEAVARLEARAEEIFSAHDVATYFFFDRSVSDVIDYTEQFVSDVPETDAIVLGMNATQYYFAVKGEKAAAVFPKSVLRLRRNKHCNKWCLQDANRSDDRCR